MVVAVGEGSENSREGRVAVAVTVGAFSGEGVAVERDWTMAVSWGVGEEDAVAVGEGRAVALDSTGVGGGGVAVSPATGRQAAIPHIPTSRNMTTLRLKLYLMSLTNKTTQTTPTTQAPPEDKFPA